MPFVRPLLHSRSPQPNLLLLQKSRPLAPVSAKQEGGLVFKLICRKIAPLWSLIFLPCCWSCLCSNCRRRTQFAMQGSKPFLRSRLCFCLRIGRGFQPLHLQFVISVVCQVLAESLFWCRLSQECSEALSVLESVLGILS